MIGLPFTGDGSTRHLLSEKHTTLLRRYQQCGVAHPWGMADGRETSGKDQLKRLSQEISAGHLISRGGGMCQLAPGCDGIKTTNHLTRLLWVTRVLG